jgi:two-component system chemotaxis response regulator CheB
VRRVKEAGGLVIAQDEATSRYFSMPQAAIETGAVDSVLPLGAIAPALVRLTAKAA